MQNAPKFHLFPILAGVCTVTLLLGFFWQGIYWLVAGDLSSHAGRMRTIAIVCAILLITGVGAGISLAGGIRGLLLRTNTLLAVTLVVIGLIGLTCLGQYGLQRYALSQALISLDKPEIKHLNGHMLWKSYKDDGLSKPLYESICHELAKFRSLQSKPLPDCPDPENPSAKLNMTADVQAATDQRREQQAIRMMPYAAMTAFILALLTAIWSWRNKRLLLRYEDGVSGA